MLESTPSTLSDNTLHQFQQLITTGWDNRDTLDIKDPIFQNAMGEILGLIDNGNLRIALPDPAGKEWTVQEWLKKAILLSFRFYPMEVTGNSCAKAYDKIPLKFATWTASDFAAARLRIVPGAIVRHGAFLAPDVIVMPSFINVGAFIDTGTMIDSGVTIGSCAQIGKKCHISSNVLIGGVLEPLQASPVIIEDEAFIGAGSCIVEGMLIRQGAVIGMGVMLGQSTPIFNRSTGQVTYGEIPPYSVVVPGVMPSLPQEAALNCAIIVKQVDARTRSKTSLNELLRPSN